MVDSKENYKFDLGVTGLTLSLPKVTRKEFLPTLSIQYQVEV